MQTTNHNNKKSYKGCLILGLIGVGVVVVILIVVGLTNSTPKEDLTQEVDKLGSVETSVSVQHADSSHDVILTSHKIWVKGNEYRTVIHTDTIPALDSSLEEAGNESGDSRLVNLKKDYQIFITVK